MLLTDRSADALRPHCETKFGQGDQGLVDHVGDVEVSGRSLAIRIVFSVGLDLVLI